MISSWSKKVKSPRTVEQLTLKQFKSCMFQLERSLFSFPSWYYVYSWRGGWNRFKGNKILPLQIKCSPEFNLYVLKSVKWTVRGSIKTFRYVVRATFSFWCFFVVEFWKTYLLNLAHRSKRGNIFKKWDSILQITSLNIRCCIFHVSYWQYSISSRLTCAHHLGILCLDKKQLLPKICITRQTISKVYFSLYT